MLENLIGLAWLVILIAALVFLQRRLQYETQSVFLLLTRRKDLSVALFSLIYFPGVLLHEGSHYLMARLLGVKTRNISLIPHATNDGRLRLGYVETAKSDILRDSLIGLAPLLAGGLVVAYIGLVQMGLASVWAPLNSIDAPAFIETLVRLPSEPDFWLWFYMAFVVSGTMFPSSSDRRAWLPVGLIGLGILLLGLIAGAGPWMLATLAPYLAQSLWAVAIVFAIALVIHVLMLPPVWALRRILNRLTGLEVVPG
jgi:hypothetical protein